MANRWQKLSLAERFAEHYTPEPNSGCWLWTANLTNSGYGMIYNPGGDSLAHRLSIVLSGRTIPTGLEAMHKCGVRSCVNPDHLTVGTHAENMREIVEGGRHYLLNRTQCLRGHPYDAENTSYSKTKSGRKRVCKTCRKINRLRRLSSQRQGEE